MSETNLDYAPGWRPDEGELIVGKVVELGVGNGQWGQYPIVTIRDASTDEDVAVHGFHHSLRNRLLELKPRQGERIGIQYKGKRASKSHPGQMVAVYIVRIDGRDAEDAWGALTPAGEPVATPERAPQETTLPLEASAFAPEPVTPDSDDIPF